MDKGIQAAKKLSDEPGKNWLPYLKESDLHLIFNPIYRMDLCTEDMNLLVAFIIFSYDNDSQKLDVRKERMDNKMRIAESIELNTSVELINDVIHNSNDAVNDVILAYLKEMTDWRWQTVMTQLDYHSNIMRFVGQKTDIEKISEKVDKEGQSTTTTQEFELTEVSKINKQKGELLNMAIEAREKAEELLGQIKKDYMTTDSGVQSDFGFSYSETAKKKVDVESWKEFVRNRKTTSSPAH